MLFGAMSIISIKVKFSLATSLQQQIRGKKQIPLFRFVMKFAIVKFQIDVHLVGCLQINEFLISLKRLIFYPLKQPCAYSYSIEVHNYPRSYWCLIIPNGWLLYISCCILFAHSFL
jgi:hypothetical protein